jgi:hypothetical protein
MAKARVQKLKVFRTPIGFHDAYVAVPSQKAALEAWGADSNLFAQGIAEVVTDAALAEAALARPGEVIRVARGSAEEHVRALGDAPKSRVRKVAANDAAELEEESGPRSRSGVTGKRGDNRPSPGPSPARRRGRKEEPSPQPPPASGRGSRKPGRGDVDKAEAALAEAEDAHREALERIRAEQEAFDRRRRELEQGYREQLDALSARLERARDEYRRAMAEWAG